MLRRSITLSCMVMALMMTMGCNWDSGLYDALVKDGNVERCPKDAKANDVLAYIVIDANDKNNSNKSVEPLICCKPEFKDILNNGNTGVTCSDENECNKYEYVSAFKYNICPGGMICDSKNNLNYCLNPLKCSGEQIVCDDKCVTPGEYGSYCGAKGNCSDEDPNSENYIGTTCNRGANCENGKCVCAADFIECEGKCISPGDRATCGAINCSDKGENCDELGKNGVVAANCDDDGDNIYKCKILQCDDNHHLDSKNNSCVKIDEHNCAYLGHDCMKDGVNPESVKCENRVCIVDCLDGYHTEGSTCVPDNKISCGKNKIDCTITDGWKDGKCEGGKCNASSCQPNYHELNDQISLCKPDSSESCNGKKCEESEVCSEGECKKNCPTGQVKCDDGACVDTTNNNNRCGSCDIRCSIGEVCNDGKCKCRDDYIQCDNKCVQSNTTEHCIGCNGCPLGTKCVVNKNGDGNNQCDCDDGNNKLTLCGDTCVDLSTNKDNCGDCGAKCDINNYAHASSATCNNGECAVSCNDNYEYNINDKKCERKKCSGDSECARYGLSGRCIDGRCEDYCNMGTCNTGKECYSTVDYPSMNYRNYVCMVDCKRSGNNNVCDSCREQEGESCVGNNAIGTCQSGKCVTSDPGNPPGTEQECRDNESCNIPDGKGGNISGVCSSNDCYIDCRNNGNCNNCSEHKNVQCIGKKDDNVYLGKCRSNSDGNYWWCNYK